MKIEPKEVFTHELQFVAEDLMKEHKGVMFVWDKNLNSSDCWIVLTYDEKNKTNEEKGN